MTRKQELWSQHDIGRATGKGSPFGSTHGSALQLSCMRCGSHRRPVELSSDAMFKGQKRCTDRDACATARGGKS